MQKRLGEAESPEIIPCRHGASKASHTPSGQNLLVVLSIDPRRAGGDLMVISLAGRQTPMQQIPPSGLHNPSAPGTPLASRLLKPSS